MARVELDESGLAELFGRTGPIAQNMRNRAERVLVAQQRMVPIGTGNLKSSLMMDVEEDGLTWHIGSTGRGFSRNVDDYVLTVEYGDPTDPDYPAQPFLRPSINAARDGGA